METEIVHSPSELDTELWREAATMVLYVSVVEIAELASLPEKHLSGGHVTGPVGAKLLAILWGTAIGLALAHFFAFRLAAPGFRGERPSRFDTYVGLVQVAAAAGVAALSSIPVLVLSDVRAQELTGDVPAIIIGIVAYLIARSVGRPRIAAVFYGVTALVVGMLVALVKTILAGH